MLRDYIYSNSLPISIAGSGSKNAILEIKKMALFSDRVSPAGEKSPIKAPHLNIKQEDCWRLHFAAKLDCGMA
jgi:hypothetical protein